MIKKSFSQIGICFFYFLSFFPFSFLYFLSNFQYYLVYYVVGYRKKVVRQNLSNSFPDKDFKSIRLIEKKFFKYFSDLIYEIIKLTTISNKELNKRVKFNGLDQLEHYFKNNISVLACTGHYGNWELCMLALGLNVSVMPHVIYKPIKNEEFENWFLQFRTRFGNVFVPKRQTLRKVIDTKNQPTMFCFASDQSPARDEVQYTLNFLNQPTAALLGLEKIAMQTKRPIFYFDVKRTRRGYYEVDILPLCLQPELTKKHEITDLFFDFLTKTIKNEPAFWLWSHRRWKLNN
jgi:KDO2-lipid IV(A) lauroyltransferase